MLRKQIDELPRTGSLLTLDVKANDIRVSATYIDASIRSDSSCICFFGRAEWSPVHCASLETESDTQSSQPEREQN